MYGYPKFEEIKDPNAKDIYYFDWSSKLVSGDIIVASELFVSPPGLTVEKINHENGVVSFWVSNGISKTNYYVTCRVDMASGKTGLDQTSILQVDER